MLSDVQAGSGARVTFEFARNKAGTPKDWRRLRTNHYWPVNAAVGGTEKGDVIAISSTIEHRDLECLVLNMMGFVIHSDLHVPIEIIVIVSRSQYV